MDCLGCTGGFYTCVYLDVYVNAQQVLKTRLTGGPITGHDIIPQVPWCDLESLSYLSIPSWTACLGWRCIHTCTYIHTYIHVCIEVNVDIDWPWGTSCAYIARAHGEVCKAARQGRDRYRRLVDDWSTGCVNCRSLFAMFWLQHSAVFCQLSPHRSRRAAESIVVFSVDQAEAHWAALSTPVTQTTQATPVKIGVFPRLMVKQTRFFLFCFVF